MLLTFHVVCLFFFLSNIILAFTLHNLRSTLDSFIGVCILTVVFVTLKTLLIFIESVINAQQQFKEAVAHRSAHFSLKAPRRLILCSLYLLLV